MSLSKEEAKAIRSFVLGAMYSRDDQIDKVAADFLKDIEELQKKETAPVKIPPMLVDETHHSHINNVIKRVVASMEDAIYIRLEAKTGWGKNQVQELVNEVAVLTIKNIEHYK